MRDAQMNTNEDSNVLLREIREEIIKQTTRYESYLDEHKRALQKSQSGTAYFFLWVFAAVFWGVFCAMRIAGKFA